MLKMRGLKVECICHRILVMVIIAVFLNDHGVVFKTSVAGSDSCEISRFTVQIVKDCPDSEDKLMEAAKRKNCAAHASQCSEPEKFLYHCVINEYVNQTLEVCAYAQNIISGQCTSYSISGNLIQQNPRTNCASYPQNPCPTFYRSNMAYLYPGCYERTKQSTTATYTPTAKTYQDSTVMFTNTPHATVKFTNSPADTFPVASVNESISPSDDMSGKEERPISDSGKLAIILCVLVLAISCLFFFSIVCNKFRKKTSYQTTAGLEEGMVLNGYTVDG